MSKYMMERQQVSTRYGFKLDNAQDSQTGGATDTNTTDNIEWIRGGTYYLSQWSAPQNGISASFKARDLLGFMNKTYYKGRFPASNEPDGISLHTLALEVLSDADLPQRKTDEGPDYSMPWELDGETLGSFTTTAPLPVCTYAECLQMIANAAGCTIYFDRDGILHIARLECGSTSEYITVDDRNSYSRPEIELTKPVKQVDVSMYAFTRETGTKDIYEGTLSIIPGNNEFIIEFSDTADTDTGRIQLSALGSTGVVLSINETEVYAKSCRLVIDSSNSQPVQCSVTVTGNVRKPAETVITVPNLPNGETQPLKNMLITSTEHALRIGQWVKDSLGRRTHVSADWRADPRIDAGDIVKTGTSGRDIRTVSSSISFSGAFKGKLEGVELS
jgi:hypothetical protein